MASMFVCMPELVGEAGASLFRRCVVDAVSSGRESAEVETAVESIFHGYGKRSSRLEMAAGKAPYVVKR